MIKSKKLFEYVWIRVAGHAARIREGSPHAWRCFIHLRQPEIPLRDVKVSSVATNANIVFGVDPTGGNALGLTAWIDYFGDITITHDDVAHIRLRQPLGTIPPRGATLPPS